ncbi:hypothetical protein D9615_005562 [Tricholomella constricta]|uniref:Rhodopsin domain-containing protein n=1 Tax=Tricholomella constricta TaxID=117010 RepID=A0A8H5HE69_9AGAR|nr:hypothetical protein D9615_005562 [Tricholomella constricta]
MASTSPITVHSLKVLGLAGPIIAAVVTLVRLFERIRSKRFGYDDGFAALSLAILVVFVVSLFTHLGDPTHLSHATRVAMYYILAQGFYGIVWAARLSILFSVIRITPNGSNLKRILYGLVGTFLLIWAILFAQVFWVCEPEPLWKDALSPQCALGRNVAIAQLISDIYADSVLIVAPLRLLWNLEVSRSQKNRLLVVFSASIGTTIASLVHAYYVLRVGGLDEVFVAVVELCVSLLVCNLAVVVGLIARVKESRKRSNFSSGESYSMSRSKLTTIGGTSHGTRSIDFKTHTTDENPSVNVKVEVDFHSDPVDPNAKYHYPDTPFHNTHHIA